MTKRKTEFIINKITSANAAVSKYCFEQQRKKAECRNCPFVSPSGLYCDKPEGLESIAAKLKIFIGGKK
jgi:hypothetical protein